MTRLESLLDFLCNNSLEREVARVLLAPGDHRSREFWSKVFAYLVNSTSCISFGCYPAIARCHVLCIAVAPECHDIWSSIVLGELTRRVTHGAKLDALVMGSQLGLFQAGKWLQENRTMLHHEEFLPAVARYCAVLIGKECIPVNISNADSELSRAQHELDRAVKDYLRPQNSDLVKQIRPQIRAMLIELKKFEFAENKLYAGTGCQADRWLLDAIIQGSLDIAHRNRNELIQAASVINT